MYGGEFVYNYLNVPCDQTVTLLAKWTPIPPDTTKPVIKAPDETITLEQAKTWTPMHGVTAHDDKDGDITSKVVAAPSVRPAAMTTTPGKYTFSYTISDAAGNTATASRTVTVVRQSVLTYQPNNGTSELPRSYTRNEGETLKIEDGSHFTAPAGKRFDHWATHSDGSGTTYRPGAMFTFTGDNVTLYAQYVTSVTAMPETGGTVWLPVVVVVFAGLGMTVRRIRCW